MIGMSSIRAARSLTIRLRRYLHRQRMNAALRFPTPEPLVGHSVAISLVTVSLDPAENGWAKPPDSCHKRPPLGCPF